MKARSRGPGVNAWTPTPADPDQVEFIEMADGAETLRWRVLDREVVGGPRGGSVPWSTTRFQLIQEGAAAAAGFDDYDHADFGQDFA